MSHPKVPTVQTLPLLGKLRVIKRLVVDDRSLVPLDVSSSELWRNMVSRGQPYYLVTPVYVAHRIMTLRRRLPSLRVDQGSFTNSRSGVRVQWWHWATQPPSHFSVYLESRNCESAQDVRPSIIRTCELSLPFTQQQLSVKLTSFRRLSLTSRRSSLRRRLGLSLVSSSSMNPGLRLGHYRNWPQDQTSKKSQ
jgi:hypothetical protein